jgi:kumamolisin
VQGRAPLPALVFPNAGKPVAHDVDRDAPIAVTVLVRPKAPMPDPVPFQYVDRDTFLRLYGPHLDELWRVQQFAMHHGMGQVIDVRRRLVTLTGSIGQMEQAFGVTMAMYSVDGGVQRGYEGVPSVPSEIADIVVAVIGLHSDAATGTPVRSSDAGNGHGLPITRQQLESPADLRAFYRFPDGDGDGQTVAIIEMGGGYRRQDVDPYFASLGISPQIKDVLVRSAEHVGVNVQILQSEEHMLAGFIDWMEGKGSCNEDQRQYFEVTMDVSMIGALVPKANINVYFGYDSVRALMYLLDEALFETQPPPSVISISWSFQERQLLADPSDVAAAHHVSELLLAAAHMGVTVCCSAGDWGASNYVHDGWPGDPGPDVNFPASSPYALACGGTTIADDGTEVVWNSDFPEFPDPTKVPSGWCKHGATGGGYSRLFARPSWQSRLGDAGAGLDAGRRALPDVAAVADPRCGIRCMMVFDDGSGQLVQRTFATGGTSAAAPIWAALVARLNQRLGQRVGCLNPILYAHAPDHPDILNDVTRGDNRFNAGDVGFDAGSDWDACTGLGTPNGEALLALLKSLLPAS